MMRTPDDDWSDFPTRFATAVVTGLTAMAEAAELAQRKARDAKRWWRTVFS